MPRTHVVFYREEGGAVPFLDWFAGLPEKARAKCTVRIERLRELGHELRRPEADYLRDEIHELRTKHAGVNYRILYFFRGRTAVVISHGLAKQQKKVSARDIRTAIERKRQFEADPEAHTHEE